MDTWVVKGRLGRFLEPYRIFIGSESIKRWSWVLDAISRHNASFPCPDHTFLIGELMLRLMESWFLQSGKSTAMIDSPMGGPNGTKWIETHEDSFGSSPLISFSLDSLDSFLLLWFFLFLWFRLPPNHIQAHNPAGCQTLDLLNSTHFHFPTWNFHVNPNNWAFPT